MTSLERNLFVKKSGLPGAGNGLYTKQFIPKGTKIVEYKGRVTSWKEVDSNDGNNGYIYYVKRYHVINALNYPRALARYANDAKGLYRVQGATNNAEYIEEGLKVYIKSVKDIPAGAEILVDYGKEYWQVIRHNLRVDRQRERNAAKTNKKK